MDQLRWSGPAVLAGLDLPWPYRKATQVRFRILMAIQPDIIRGLALTANGLPVELQYVNDSDGAFIFSGEIPAEAMSGPFIRLIFSVPGTTAPCSVDSANQDERPVGFLLNWIELNRHKMDVCKWDLLSLLARVLINYRRSSVRVAYECRGRRAYDLRGPLVGKGRSWTTRTCRPRCSE